MHIGPWIPESEIDGPCNILIIGHDDLCRRASADILMRLQPALKLTGAVVFTESTDPALMGNILPEEVIYRDADHSACTKRLLSMQRQAHGLRGPQAEANSSRELVEAARSTHVDRIAVVYDAVATESADFRHRALRDMLENGGNENIINIVCVPNAAGISSTVRSRFKYALIGYTNIQSDVKTAASRVFGMFDSPRDLQDMVTDLSDDMLLVADMRPAGRTLASMLRVYTPDIYRAVPITDHMVHNRGKWHMHADVEIEEAAHLDAEAGGAAAAAAPPRGASDRISSRNTGAGPATEASADTVALGTALTELGTLLASTASGGSSSETQAQSAVAAAGNDATAGTGADVEHDDASSNSRRSKSKSRDGRRERDRASKSKRRHRHHHTRDGSPHSDVAPHPSAPQGATALVHVPPKMIVGQTFHLDPHIVLMIRTALSRE